MGSMNSMGRVFSNGAVARRQLVAFASVALGNGPLTIKSSTTAIRAIIRNKLSTACWLTLVDGCAGSGFASGGRNGDIGVEPGFAALSQELRHTNGHWPASVPHRGCGEGLASAV